jgi:SRSO17 transposase
MSVKVSPYPIPELVEFLRPFRELFYRVESFWTLERYATGLLAEVERKSGAGIAEAVAGLSESALYRLMNETYWDLEAVNQQRVAIMRQRTTTADGVLGVDDT